jgi:hypothetical protein
VRGGRGRERFDITDQAVYQGSHEVRLSFHWDLYYLLTSPKSIAGYDMSARDQHWDVRRWRKSSDFRFDLRTNKV